MNLQNIVKDILLKARQQDEKDPNEHASATMPAVRKAWHAMQNDIRDAVREAGLEDHCYTAMPLLFSPNTDTLLQKILQETGGKSLSLDYLDLEDTLEDPGTLRRVQKAVPTLDSDIREFASQSWLSLDTKTHEHIADAETDLAAAFVAQLSPDQQKALLDVLEENHPGQ